jgi:hypothetical protein
MENQTNPETIEFNSMVAILRRLDRITNNINESRDNRDGITMLDNIISYFKEISPDLNNDEKKIWDEIQKVKRFCNPLMQNNMQNVLNKLDVIDIKLRGYAKTHGYLTRVIKDVRNSVIDM